MDNCFITSTIKTSLKALSGNRHWTFHQELQTNNVQRGPWRIQVTIECLGKQGLSKVKKMVTALILQHRHQWELLLASMGQDQTHFEGACVIGFFHLSDNTSCIWKLRNLITVYQRKHQRGFISKKTANVTCTFKLTYPAAAEQCLVWLSTGAKFLWSRFPKNATQISYWITYRRKETSLTGELWSSKSSDMMMWKKAC